jgi:hypothetical protein
MIEVETLQGPISVQKLRSRAVPQTKFALATPRLPSGRKGQLVRRTASSHCPYCDQRMQLVRTIPRLGPAWPTLLAFYCAPCCHAETKQERAV